MSRASDGGEAEPTPTQSLPGIRPKRLSTGEPVAYQPRDYVTLGKTLVNEGTPPPLSTETVTMSTPHVMPDPLQSLKRGEIPAPSDEADIRLLVELVKRCSQLRFEDRTRSVAENAVLEAGKSALSSLLAKIDEIQGERAPTRTKTIPQRTTPKPKQRKN